MASSQMKDRPGFLYANAFSQAIRTECREVGVSAVRTFEFFHDFLPCNSLQSDHDFRLACEIATFQARYRRLRTVVNALATCGNKALKPFVLSRRKHRFPRVAYGALLRQLVRFGENHLFDEWVSTVLM